MRKLLLFFVVVVVHQPYVAFVFAVYIPRADGRNLLAGIIGRNGCCDETTLSHNRDANQQFVVEDRPARCDQPFLQSKTPLSRTHVVLLLHPIFLFFQCNEPFGPFAT
jgi:hypothetical protein